MQRMIAVRHGNADCGSAMLRAFLIQNVSLDIMLNLVCKGNKKLWNMQIIPHFFFVFPLPQPASPIFKEDPIASTRHPIPDFHLSPFA